MQQVAEWNAPAPEEFREQIAPRRAPAVLRGIAASWPLVVAAKDGTRRCMTLLAARASAEPLIIIRADPSLEGRFHYGPDGRAGNFIRGRGPMSALLTALAEEGSAARPFAIAAQAATAEEYLPGFRASHPMPFVPSEAFPRMWIGNAAKVGTHNDPTDNIAVVAAGRRRFTLFPPEAEDDLYMGPARPSPAGTPVSMVHVTAPDLDAYPRYKEALAKALEAELGPGDAIFIPADWFHHVEALESFNILVNYWWPESSPAAAP